MRYTHLLLLLPLLAAGRSQAQTIERQVIGSSGASFEVSSAFSAEHTTGESSTATGSAGSFILSQGFQQTQTGGTRLPGQDLQVNYSLYPNPAGSNIQLSLQAAKPFSLRISMTDAAGRTIMADDKPTTVSASYQREFSLQQLAAGIYFINLSEERQLIKSIRFQKL